MEDKVTKKDIAEALYRGLQDAIELSKSEDETLAKAWGPKPAGKKLPRRAGSPSVYDLLEGHRPLKPGEKVQVGDKIVGRNTPAGQYHPDEVWETIHEKHPDLNYTIRPFRNIAQSHQRPVSQQQPPMASAPVASPSVRPAQPSRPAPSVSKIPDIGRMGGGIDYFDRSQTLPSPHSIKPSNSSQPSPAPVGTKTYSYSNHS